MPQAEAVVTPVLYSIAQTFPRLSRQELLRGDGRKVNFRSSEVGNEVSALEPVLRSVESCCLEDLGRSLAMRPLATRQRKFLAATANMAISIIPQVIEHPRRWMKKGNSSGRR